MRIKIVKIASYGSNILKLNKYDFYTRSSRQEIDPGVDTPISYELQYKKHSYKKAYCSELERAIASARYLSKKVVGIKELNEIKFDLKKLLSREEYMKYGSKLVRERFVNAFIEDNLLEPRKSVMTRVDKLIDRFSKSIDDEFVCVSHSFFMKVLEASIDGCDLSRSPELIRGYIDVDQKTYKFGEGFIINVQSTRGEI